MLRCAVFALAVSAILPDTRAAVADPTGNWVVNYVLPTGDNAVCILKVETEGGKPTATVAFAPKGAEYAVSDFAASDKQVTFTLKQSFNSGGQSLTTSLKFAGTPGKDGKVVVGNMGPDTAAAPRRAKLTTTAKDKLEVSEMFTADPNAALFTQASNLQGKPTQIQIKMQREKDADAKKELQKELTAARAELTKLPDLYRDVVAKHPDTVAAAESAMLLFRNPQVKLTPDEAAKLADVVRKQSEAYGEKFAKANMTALAEAVATRKDVGPLGLTLVEPLAKALTDSTKAADQVKVLTLYKAALTNAGKGDEAKAIDARLVKLETKLDEEYLATVPPFKPTPYAGRKAEGANQVAVMELFTGAQCPPCVAADVAFDGLLKAYKPTDLVLIQYHVHIPGPDPLTTAESEKRFAYYRAEFPKEMGGAPSVVFNGKPAAVGGGGGMAQGEGKFKQYMGLIDPILEKKTAVKVGGTATRTGDKIAIAVSVDGADGDDMKVRLLVVEDVVKYVGGNQIRMHHHVVRAMPGGVDGVAIKDKAFKHTATADVAEVRSTLTKYLDDYAANTRPFPNPNRPMDMAHLKVIALVQNDKTKEIVQAVQLELDGKAAGTTGQ